MGKTVATISEEELRSIVGDLSNSKLMDILKLRPTIAELEEAMIWASGDGDILSRQGRPISRTAAQIVDILTADEDEPPPS